MKTDADRKRIADLTPLEVEYLERVTAFCKREYISPSNLVKILDDPRTIAFYKREYPEA